jgi:hypothetical protein
MANNDSKSETQQAPKAAPPIKPEFVMDPLGPVVEED